MPLTPAKCTECGGFVEVDSEKRLGVCQHCGNPFVVEEAIQTFNTYYNTTNNYNTTHNYGEGAVVNVYENQNSVSSLIERAFMFLEDGNFANADEYCEKALDLDPKCAEAYLGKLMVANRVKQTNELANLNERFDNDSNYQKLVRFADTALLEELEGYLNIILNRIDEKLNACNILAQKRNKYLGTSKLISTNNAITVGVKSDGIIVATEYTGEYDGDCGQLQASAWKDIVAVSVGSCHIVGLKSNGTVVAVGKNYNGECNTTFWEDIVAVSAGGRHTVGLKSDGTVIAVGKNDDFQCNVSDWTDIVSIFAHDNFTIGIKSDGTVLAKGFDYSKSYNVEKWKNIVDISAQYSYSSGHAVGLKSDGTVVATGTNLSGQCNVSDWTDIIAISAGALHTVGLKADGTVVAVGDNRYGECNVSDWTDIIAITTGGSCHTVGLKSDGTVVAVGSNNNGACKVFGWKLFNNIETIDEERSIAKERRIAEEQKIQLQSQYRSQGLCQHCGGELKGLFRKKCVKCGKPQNAEDTVDNHTHQNAMASAPRKKDVNTFTKDELDKLVTRYLDGEDLTAEELVAIGEA